MIISRRIEGSLAESLAKHNRDEATAVAKDLLAKFGVQAREDILAFYAAVDPNLFYRGRQSIDSEGGG